MEIAKTANGAILVFLGSILIAVGLEAVYANELLLGISMTLVGGYLTLAVFYDHFIKNIWKRVFGKEEISSATSSSRN